MVLGIQAAGPVQMVVEVHNLVGGTNGARSVFRCDGISAAVQLRNGIPRPIGQAGNGQSLARLDGDHSLALVEPHSVITAADLTAQGDEELEGTIPVRSGAAHRLLNPQCA